MFFDVPFHSCETASQWPFKGMPYSADVFGSPPVKAVVWRFEEKHLARKFE